MTTPLIGTGYYASAQEQGEKGKFFWAWCDRFEGRDIVVADNSESGCPVEIQKERTIRRVRVLNNIGHIGHWLGKANSPRWLGWSMSWMIPALIAHSERRDFLYVEQDCLLFGDCEQEFLSEAESAKKAVLFGTPTPAVAACEQSLFWIRCDYIPQFIAAYACIDHPDAEMLPEAKFVQVMANDKNVGWSNIPYGRRRPIDVNVKNFYAQKLTCLEIADLKKAGRL